MSMLVVVYACKRTFVPVYTRGHARVRVCVRTRARVSVCGVRACARDRIP
jgi:hypothetical protein